MSVGIGLLLAIGILILLFSLLLFLFQENHPLLRYVFIMSILVAGFFIPTAVYQLRTTCDTVVSNSTAVNGSITSYAYTQQCFTTSDIAPDTFYSVFWSIYQIIILYFIVRVIVLMFGPLWERMRRW